ncbi:hypothetical protein HYV80_06940 [Candidatus Woesearchaeota archaeon]|nr:hypothetical protein [Candidatus Woesearchaeota archaeon]
MGKNEVLVGLRAIKGLKIHHFPLSATYTLYTKVPYDGQVAEQIVGRLNFRRGEYTTQYPPNFEQFAPGDETARTLGGLQQEVLKVLEKNGMVHQGIAREVQDAGFDVLAAHSRDQRTTPQIAHDILEATYPTGRPPRNRI